MTAFQVSENNDNINIIVIKDFLWSIFACFHMMSDVITAAFPPRRKETNSVNRNTMHSHARVLLVGGSAVKYRLFCVVMFTEYSFNIFTKITNGI